MEEHLFPFILDYGLHATIIVIKCHIYLEKYATLVYICRQLDNQLNPTQVSHLTLRRIQSCILMLIRKENKLRIKIKELTKNSDIYNRL